MTNRLFFLNIILLSTLATSLFGQQKAADFINLDALQAIEPVAVQKINSEQFDFAPVRYENGLLFVQSKTEKRRIKKKKDIDFRLAFSSFDENGELQEKVDFPALRQEGSFEGPISVSPDGNLLFITRNLLEERGFNEENELKLGIYIYERNSGGWILSDELPFNNIEYNVCHPSWDNNNQKLYFASDMPGGFGKLDIYESKRQSDGSWNVPKNLGPAVNSFSNDCFPGIYKEKYLFYCQGQHNKDADLNIYFSVNESGTWLTNVRLPENINSEMDDLCWYMDEDRGKAYFASSRQGGKGQDDIYSINLPMDFISEPVFSHKLEVFDQNTGKAIEACLVKFIPFDHNQPVLENFDGTKVSLNYPSKNGTADGQIKYETDADGQVNFVLPKGEYIIQLQKEDFYTFHKLLIIYQTGGEYKIGLEPKICHYVSFNFVDKGNGEEIHGVKSVWDNERIQREEDGIKEKYCFYKKDQTRFTFSSEGYEEAVRDISFNSLKAEDIITIELEAQSAYVNDFPLNSGEKFILENILYDFDQFTLNKAAKAELDKLVAHLKNNPKITLELSSHTDSRGKEIYNQMLSDKRAETARKYLIDRGVEGYRIAAIGYGESRLVNHCSDNEKCSEEQHSVNRRTEIKVLTH